MLGSCTVTTLAAIWPGVKFSDEVEGTPVASPGRTLTKPDVVGSTAVTLATTAVAPTGTTMAVPEVVATGPVTFTNLG